MYIHIHIYIHLYLYLYIYISHLMQSVKENMSLCSSKIERQTLVSISGYI